MYRCSVCVYSFGHYWFSNPPHSVNESMPLMGMLRSSATVRKCSRLVGHTIHLRFVAEGFYRCLHFMHFQAADLQYRDLLHPPRHLRLLQPSCARVRKCSRLVGHTIHLRFVAGGFYRRLVEEQGVCCRRLVEEQGVCCRSVNRTQVLA